VTWIDFSAGDQIVVDSPAGAIDLFAIPVMHPSPNPRVGPITVSPANIDLTTFAVLDAHGARIPFTPTRTALANNVYQFTFAHNGITGIVIPAELAVIETCVTSTVDSAYVAAVNANNSKRQNALASGASSTAIRPLLKPNTQYAITVSTTATRRDDGTVYTFTDTATFKTGAAAGLQDPTTAPVITNSSDAPPAAYPYGGPLADATPYIAGTVPIAESARLRLRSTDNAYRGYDPTVTFSEGYIQTMYRSANAPLTLNVTDLNGQPVSGTHTFVSRPRSRGRFDSLWQTRLQPCGITPQSSSAQAAVLQLDARNALSPRRGYWLTVTAGKTVVGKARVNTSRYLTIAHQIQSHLGVTRIVSINAAQTASIVAASFKALNGGAVTDDEADQFDSLIATLGIGPLPIGEVTDVITFRDSSAARLIAVTNPEPLPWDRLSISAQHGAAPLPNLPVHGHPARRMKIVDVGVDANHIPYVDCMWLSDGDPSGITIAIRPPLPPRPIPLPTSPVDVYRFAAEGNWPGGTVFRIAIGSNAAAVSPDIQLRNASTSTATAIGSAIVSDSSGQLDIRAPLQSPGALNPYALRSRDGRSVLLAQANGAAFSAGPIDLKFAISRNLDSSDPTRTLTRLGSTGAEAAKLRVTL
jgi:hypothetical protein